MLQAKQHTDRTCQTCGKPRTGELHTLTRNNYDPTRTTTLRNQFSRQMGKRFRELRGVIRRKIVDDDCFGMMNPHAYRQDFDFPRSGDKVNAFMEWLGEQERQGILEIRPGQQVGEAVESAWTNQYVESAYQKGVYRARQELVNAGYPVPGLEETGGIDQAFNQPFHMDRVGTLYTRVFRDLKGITDNMDDQISRVLSQAMAEGRHPREMARLLTRTISGPVGDLALTDTLGRFIPAERRARILARTEVIRAHHQATIQEYRNWGAEGVRVRAEWSTAGDGRVCPECAMMEGREYSLKEIEGMIPRHPQCRCIALPKDVTDEGRAEEVPQISPDEIDPIHRESVPLSEIDAIIDDPEISGTDRTMKILKRKGYTDTPTTVSPQTLDSLDGTTLHRGISSTTEKNVEEIFTQFKQGEYRLGQGFMVNGTYVSYGDEAKKWAQVFANAKRGDDALTFRMKLKPNLNIKSREVLRKELGQEFGEEANERISNQIAQATRVGNTEEVSRLSKELQKNSSRYEFFKKDLTSYAAYRDVDMVSDIGEKFGSAREGSILNRTAVIVEDKGASVTPRQTAAAIQEYKNTPARKAVELRSVGTRTAREAVEEVVEEVPVETQLSAGEVTQVSDLGGGVNETQIVTLLTRTKEPRKELKGVFKPVGGEVFGDIRSTINNSDFPLAHREVLASRIDDALDLGMTPKTVMREIDGKPGSLQHFVDDTETLMSASDPDQLLSQLSPDDVYRTSVFDYIIGNTDRHSGNILFKNNRPVLIDHGYSFPDGIDELQLDFQKRYSRAVFRKRRESDRSKKFDRWEAAVSDSTKEEIKQAISRLDVDELVKDFSMTEDEIRLLKTRITDVQEGLDEGALLRLIVEE